MANKFINIRHNGELDQDLEKIQELTHEATITGAVRKIIKDYLLLRGANQRLRYERSELIEYCAKLEVVVEGLQRFHHLMQETSRLDLDEDRPDFM